MLYSPPEFEPDSLSKKCPACAETIKLEALVCRFCAYKFEPATVQAAVQEARTQFEKAKAEFDKKFSAMNMDKLSRNLCPNCHAYAAWETDVPNNLRKCEVCGEKYPLVIQAATR